MSQLLTFQTKPPKSIFAPVGKYYIFEDNISNVLNFNTIKNTILKKEKEIIKKYPFVDDGNTGLGDSLTSRFPHFNLLEWPEMVDIKNSIRKTHNKFLKLINEDYNIELFSQCWANVMRKGDVIKKHSHYNSNYTYLGGHICIQSNNTSTHYVDPYTKEIFSSKNEFGKITLFPNWIEHYTDEVVDNKLRIPIAFDLINEVTFKEDIYNNMKHHWIKL